MVSSNVAQDVAEVSQSADAISRGSSDVRANAGNLSQMAEQLRILVGHFKV
jgi:methyl-accepting chemotaxis protein